MIDKVTSSQVKRRLDFTLMHGYCPRCIHTVGRDMGGRIPSFCQPTLIVLFWPQRAKIEPLDVFIKQGFNIVRVDGCSRIKE
jgi:hypothetical protein